MPRPLRVHLTEGALQYVTSRAVEGTPLFRSERDYETYLKLLKQYQAQYGFKLFAFVLLPDHLHLCLELTNGTTLSTIMHAINSRYTKYVAKRYGHSGHLFQERFRLTIVEKAPYLLHLIGYLHTHPVRSHLAADVTAYQWSSLQQYLSAELAGSETGISLVAEACEVLTRLSQEHPGMDYERYLRSVTAETWEQLREQLQNSVVGSQTFLAHVEEQRRRAQREELDEVQPSIHPSTPVTMDTSRRPIGLSASLAVAALALITAAFSTRAVMSSERTVRALGQENQRVFAALLSGIRQSTGVHLASFMRPQYLVGTSWNVHLQPVMAGNGEEAATDQLRFTRDRVLSTRLADAGFAASPFRVTQQDHHAVWETVQAGPNGETASWRGTWNGTTMEGVMTRQRPDRTSETFRFVGISARSEI